MGGGCVTPEMRARGVRVVRVLEADYAASLEEIRRIRFAVFVAEQGVPVELEMDERDDACIHVLAYPVAADGAGAAAETRAPTSMAAAVGTGRIDLGAGGKIGRVAVEAAARGCGVGTAIMRALHEIATAHGLARVWCHAQVSAVPFYTRLGYRTVGDEFEEAGIVHVKMERTLRSA